MLMAEQHLEAKIKDIKSTRKPLVVLLKGPGKDSSMMEMILRTSGLATLRDQATLFVLTASDEMSDLPAIAHALRKASLPDIQTADLPVVLVLDDEGKALSLTQGLVTAGELQQSLTRGVSAFSEQACQSNTAEEPSPASGNTTGVESPAVPSPVVSAAPAKPSSSPAAGAMSQSPAMPSLQQPATPAITHQPMPSTAGRSEARATTDKMDLNHTVQLQIDLPDGQKLRGSFKGSTQLQDVRSYIQENRPELRNQDYSIVSLHLGQEFSAGDLKSSLADLGVQSQTSLRLRNKESHSGQGSLLEKLMQLLLSLNPMGLVSWILSKLSGPGAQYSQREHDPPAGLQSEEQASGISTARQNAYSQAMKRKNAEARKVHTVHDNNDQEGQGDDPDGNSYWNGNSTKFDADDK